MSRKRIAILGATGSIGQNTLAVVDEHPDKFEVFALSARQDIDTLFLQCQTYQPQYVVVLKIDAANKLKQKLISINSKTQVLCGANSLDDIVKDEAVDIVVAAIVGAAGLKPTLSAVLAGKRILLANKESLVMAGHLFMDAVNVANAELIPIDSEHNAIYQCLAAEKQNQDFDIAKEISRIILTASGGALRNCSAEELKTITPEQACNHPNWLMGKKISIDSASLMNKGLELIEAHWLFDIAPDKLEVLIHPQSIIHSLVEFCDGSVLAQMSHPDMRIPIAYGLSYPERLAICSKPLDLLTIKSLTFESPDEQRFPCLRLAKQALFAGGTAPTILNAANEVAVEAFITGQIGFTDIPKVIHHVLDRLDYKKANSIDEILEKDRLARELSQTFLFQSVN